MTSSIDLISVIVPVYNVEKYLERAVASILKQTYKQLEIILVDDGSTDGSSALCDRLAREDPRIKVIHQKNGGLSCARNSGIAAATGAYLCFVDSDDFIAPSFVKKLYAALKKHHTLIAQCDISLVSTDGRKELAVWTEKSGVDLIDGNQLSLDAVDLKKSEIENTVVWNRLYARELLSPRSFKKGRLHEDEFFTYRVLYNQPVALVHEKLYFYTQNPNGIMQSPLTTRRLDMLDAFIEKIEFYKAQSELQLLNQTLNYSASLTIALYLRFLRTFGRDLSPVTKEKFIATINFYLATPRTKSVRLTPALRFKLLFLKRTPLLYFKLYQLKEGRHA